MNDMKSLMTVFRNNSGTRRKFTFLPPHGLELAADEEVAVLGDPIGAVIRGDRITSAARFKGLQEALDNNKLDIVRTPAVVMEDTVTGNSGQLRLVNGTLGVVDPSWDSDTDDDA